MWYIEKNNIGYNEYRQCKGRENDIIKPLSAERVSPMPCSPMQRKVQAVATSASHATPAMMQPYPKFGTSTSRT